MARPKLGGRARLALHALEAVVGYVLSPLSWWNDPIVNIPISAAAGAACASLHSGLFPACFAAAYAATNAAGLAMLVHGAAGVTSGLSKPAKLGGSRGKLLKSLALGLAYTAAATLVYIVVSAGG